MSRARLGRKLEDAIADYVTAQKGTYLDGCAVYAANSASVVHVPFLVVWCAVTQPQGGPEENGMHGPQRAVVKLRITEHKSGTLIGQWSDELAEILSRRLRFGYVHSLDLDDGIIETANDSGPLPQVGDELVIGEQNYSLLSFDVVDGFPSRYSITIEPPDELTVGASARRDNPNSRPEEMTQLISAMNVGGDQHPDTGLHVTRIAWVDEVTGDEEDCRTFEITLEIDGQAYDEP